MRNRCRTPVLRRLLPTLWISRGVYGPVFKGCRDEASVILGHPSEKNDDDSSSFGVFLQILSTGSGKGTRPILVLRVPRASLSSFYP